MFFVNAVCDRPPNYASDRGFQPPTFILESVLTPSVTIGDRVEKTLDAQLEDGETENLDDRDPDPT